MRFCSGFSVCVFGCAPDCVQIAHSSNNFYRKYFVIMKGERKKLDFDDVVERAECMAKKEDRSDCVYTNCLQEESKAIRKARVR